MGDRARRVVRRIAVAFVAVAVLSVGAFLVWAWLPLGPDSRALTALSTDDEVRVAQVEGRYVFEPAGGGASPRTGLVFYPGGHVDVRSYAPLCREIARRGHVVVLQPMPLSLAVFGIRSGLDAPAGFPGVQVWGLAGHSLGGAMAAQLVADEPGAFDALALLGAWPPDGVDLTRSRSRFLSAYGSEDGGAEEIRASASQLPAGTPFVRIDGGNHAQMGDYGPQPGDGDASISHARQQAQVADAIDAMLRAAAGTGRL